MDKNMINIDDLIRQRLSGGEEEERAGAWLRMQELLDKEQPVRGAAYFSWKRIFSYAAGLVLLAVAGVAGYKATQSNTNADVAGINRYNRANNAMLSDAVSAPNATGNVANTTPGNEVAASEHQHTRNLIKENTVAKQSGFVASTGKDASTIAIQKKSNINNTPAPLNTINKNLTTKNPAPEKQSSNNLANTNTAVDVLVNATNKTLANDNKQQNVAANKVVAATISNKKQQLPVEVTNPRYRKQIKTIDSVEVITTKESSRKGLRKIDTIAQGMVATEKVIDVPTDVVASASASTKAPREILPSATLMERNNPELINNVASTDIKTDNKQTKNAYNSHRFEEMVQNMKIDFGKASFHPGLLAGISSSVGAYNMMGVQLGVVGIMNISDHWGMFAEFKGIYRFGNGKSLVNNYYTVDKNNPAYNNNTYTYRWDSVAHSFNISSSTSLELPIAVKYSANRLNAFAGVNGSYNFAVKVDEYSQNYARSYVTNTANVQPLVEKWGENNVINYDAFKARFMLGYVVGAGYQVSPDMGVDLRMTQPFFESNAGTKSSAIVSKQLYRAPSFQLNFTYKFSNNKYKPRELNY